MVRAWGFLPAQCRLPQLPMGGSQGWSPKAGGVAHCWGLRISHRLPLVLTRKPLCWDKGKRRQPGETPAGWGPGPGSTCGTGLPCLAWAAGLAPGLRRVLPRVQPTPACHPTLCWPCFPCCRGSALAPQSWGERRGPAGWPCCSHKTGLDKRELCCGPAHSRAREKGPAGRVGPGQSPLHPIPVRLPCQCPSPESGRLI